MKYPLPPPSRPSPLPTIQGWCNFSEYYERIAMQMPDNANLVELGAWLGCSTVVLAFHLCRYGKGNATIYAVDTWLGSPDEPIFAQLIAGFQVPALEQFRANVRAYGFQEMIVPIQADSAEAAASFRDASLDFVFHDTAHTESCLTRELLAWRPKLKPGALYGGHDAIESVQAALRRHVDKFTLGPTCWESRKG